MTDNLPAAVDRIADLAKSAHGFDIQSFTVPEMPGLPPSIPIGFDRRRRGDGDATIDLRKFAESWRLYPERRKGVAQASTLESFVELVRRHKTPHSVIFAKTTWPNPTLTAVLDYHETGSGKPGFGEHRVVYPFPVTEEFKAWADRDEKLSDQTSFATFIEDRVAELADPTKEERQEFETLFKTKFATPAEMVELSRGLEVSVESQVKNIVTLQTGEAQIMFVEQHLNADGNKIIVPGLFMISVPAFLEGEAVRVPARLRYRVNSGAIGWSYKLYRWKPIVRERVVDDLDVAVAETGLPAYEGSAEGTS